MDNTQHVDWTTYAFKFHTPKSGSNITCLQRSALTVAWRIRGSLFVWHHAVGASSMTGHCKIGSEQQDTTTVLGPKIKFSAGPVKSTHAAVV